MAMLFTTFKLLLSTVVFIYVVVPVCLFLFPSIHSFFIFMNFVNFPRGNLSNVSDYGVIQKARNFYIYVNSKEKIGIWHVLPQDSAASFDIFVEENPIILYLHGNSFNRAQAHRVNLYNVLSAANCHVFALDYRGYGDSDGFASELNAVEDSIAAFRWIRTRAPRNPLILFGHSLGTAIGGHTAKRLCEIGSCPDGIIFESGFNNFSDIVRHIPITQAYTHLPFFNAMLIDPPRNYLNIHMDTDENIKDVTCPILVLHAEDDFTAPKLLAERLFDAVKIRKDAWSKMIMYKAAYGYRHINLCKDPDFGNKIRDFVKVVRDPLRKPLKESLLF